MEEVIKVWCRGSKENPQGVLKALTDAGLREFKDEIFRDATREAMSNPHNIFFSGQDAYGNKNFIGYHNENELMTRAIIKGWDPGWTQLHPVKVPMMINLQDAWHPFSSTPSIFDRPQHMKNILFWDGEYDIKMLFVSARDFPTIDMRLGFKPKFYADVRDLLPISDR